MTNRALVLALLADGSSTLAHPLRSRDTLLMAAGLRALGAEVDDGGDIWRVTSGGTPLAVRSGSVDVGNAGTVARFLPPAAALADGSVAFDGDPRVRERPLAPLLAALTALGVDLDDGGRGALPATIHGRGRVRGGRVEVDASSSSQLVSGLLLPAARFDEGIELRHVGPPIPSTPHVVMTIRMLTDLGIPATGGADRWTVSPADVQGFDLAIEPDLSTAAAYLAAAVVTGGRVHVPGWPRETTQPGAVLPSLFERMGATVELADAGLTVTGGELRGLDVDLHDVGELTPVLAAVAAVAAGPSRLRGIAHLRLHETDRLAALAREIGALGGDVRETDDGLEIRPRPLHGGPFATYDDHRLAMAAAVLGLVAEGVEVENIATTAKTDPDFTDRWLRLVHGEAA